MKGGLVLYVVLLTGCSTSAVTLPVQGESIPTATVTAVAPTPSARPLLKPKHPKQLSLASGVKAPIVPVELNSGSLVPPSNPSVIGWWGQKVNASAGTTLLVGHTVHDGGGKFDDLEDTRVGSTIKVSGVRYTVSDVQVMSKKKLAKLAPDLFNQSGPHKLVLVTCEGYDPATRTYSDNVVVTALAAHREDALK
jgi:hypothetical protein